MKIHFLSNISHQDINQYLFYALCAAAFIGMVIFVALGGDL